MLSSIDRHVLWTSVIYSGGDKFDTDYGSVRCLCSKKSSCKSNRCDYRAVSGFLGVSCGCDSIKCSNQKTSIKKDNQLSSLDVLGDDIAENSQTLSSQGTMFVQNAHSEKADAV